MSEQCIETIRELYERFGEIEFKRLQQALEASASLAEPWLIVWESFEYEPRRWHDGGDRVAVELVQRGRTRNWLQYATRIGNVWTFEDEKVVRLQFFVSWEEAMGAIA
jgi:ketosteroid isomerase-like protein